MLITTSYLHTIRLHQSSSHINVIHFYLLTILHRFVYITRIYCLHCISLLFLVLSKYVRYQIVSVLTGSWRQNGQLSLRSIINPSSALLRIHE